MERRKFIQLTGLSTLGILSGATVLNAAEENSISTQIISIQDANIHARHGLFDLHASWHQDGIQVQRDIMSRDGLAVASPDRMTTIKVKEGTTNIFGLWTRDAFSCDSDKLRSVRLASNVTTKLSIQETSLIFSEYADLQLGAIQLGKNQGILIDGQQEIAFLSKTDQAVFIYKLNS